MVLYADEIVDKNEEKVYNIQNNLCAIGSTPGYTICQLRGPEPGTPTFAGGARTVWS